MLLTKIAPVVYTSTLAENVRNDSNLFQARNQRSRQLESWSFENISPPIKGKHGFTWHWYAKNNDGKGMCVTHSPQYHDDWAQKNIQGKCWRARDRMQNNYNKKSTLELLDSLQATLTTGNISSLTTLMETYSKHTIQKLKDLKILYSTSCPPSLC